VQCECFAFAHAGAHDDFVEFGEWVGDLGAMVVEGDGLVGRPAQSCTPGWPGHSGVAGGVARKTVVAHGVGQGAGQGGHAAATSWICVPAGATEDTVPTSVSPGTAAKDSGFTPTTFIDALRAINRLQQPDWAEGGISELDAERLRALFDEWRTQLRDALAN
jgi:hypothetical protein